MNNYLKITIACWCLLGFACSTLSAQEKEITKDLYTSEGIADSLKENANSVLRFQYEEYNVSGPGKYIYKSHSIVTVLNEKADYQSYVALGYNKKFVNVSSFEMVIYDASGKQIKKYHKSDLYDQAIESEESLVSDERKLSIVHTIASYPTTVEISYEKEVNSSFDLGGWAPKEEAEQSVQHAYCRVSIAPNAGFRYLNNNIKISPQLAKSADKDVYMWEVSNIKATKKEESILPDKVIPQIWFAQSKFNCFGYPGDFSTWSDFGKWIYDLNKDVCTLSPQRVEEVRKMTDSIKSEKLKVKFLYELLQKSMRYVSVDLGIGGFKPFDANFVDQKKYGDCKALANYMYALLKAINIPSYWVVINRGMNGKSANAAFPYNVFNHEILVVPFKNDTTWLECTGNHQPFGTLDESTLDRVGVMVTENGGKLVHTPKSKPSNNEFNCNVHLQLKEDGGAKATILINATGEYRLEYIELTATKLDDQKEFWQRVLDIKQPTVFDYDPGKDTLYTKHVNLNLEYDKFCDVIAGDKQFYRAMVFPLFRFTAPVEEKRVNDYYFDFPLQKSCVTTIDLPSGYEVESLPANASLKFTNGLYTLNYVYNKDKNQVIGTAKFVLNNQVIPAAKYTEMQEYFDSVAKAQNKKLVIKKKV